MKGPKSREVRLADLEKVKCCTLKVFDNYILSLCRKNSNDEWTNDITNKIDEGVANLANKLFT